MTIEPINIGLEMLWEEFLSHAHRKGIDHKTFVNDYESFRAAYLVLAGSGSGDETTAALCYKLVTDAYCDSLKRV